MYKSIDLDPKITIANISASNSPIFMILDSLDSSHLVLARPSAKMVIYITNQIFPLSRSYKGQLKVKQKEASYCTCFTYTRLWGLLVTLSNLFHVCPLFLAMHETPIYTHDPDQRWVFI